jgi:glycosyltransferase involved in cell wall biosynthesis
MNAHIGLIAYGLDRAPAGIARYTKELAAALCHAGVDVTILQAGNATYKSNAVRLFGSGLMPGLLSIGQVEIARIARRQKLAVVHDPTGCVPTLLTSARRVSTIHDAIPYIYPHTSTRLDWLIYHYWLPLAVRRLDAIITVSEQSKADILRYLPVKAEDVTVVPEAAGPRYRPMEPARSEEVLLRLGISFPYILYVGSIEARKNLARLLEAYAQLRCWSQKWKLVIVGAPKWKYTPIFDKLQQLQLASEVHFTGHVADEDLPALYNGAAVFVFPSLYEGFGLPVLEAMACGVPVITSNCSSLPEVAGDAALLVEPRDVNAIAAAMRRVLEEFDVAAELRAKGLARARQFTWERTAKETIAVYTKATRKCSG